MVRWVRQINDSRPETRPVCRLVGREPVTSTALLIEGRVTEERHDRYDRGFTVTARDGSTFRVGGTNTTSSIAAFFTVIEAPVSLLPHELRSWTDVPAVAEAVAVADAAGDTTDGLRRLASIEYWARSERLVVALQEPLDNLLPSGKRLLEELRTVRVLVPPEAATEPVWSAVVDHLASVRTTPALRARACEVLGLLPSRTTLTVLADALRAEEEIVSRSAALALRAMEYELLRLASESPHDRALFVADTRKALEESPDAETRVYIAEALGYFGIEDEDVLGALISALADDQEEHVRWASAVALGRRAHASEAIEPLIACVESEFSERVRRAALLSVGRLLKRSSLDPLGIPLPDDKISELERELVDMLSGSDEGLKTYAAYSLGELPEVSPNTIDRLLENLQAGGAYSTTAHVVLALSKVLTRQRFEQDQRDALRSAMADPTFLRDERQHPASSYQEWFTLTAWRVLSRLEASELAARFANRARDLFREYPARSNYFAGLAHQQLAESSLAAGSMQPALSSLDQASNAFGRAAIAQGNRVPGDLGDSARLAAVTRQSLATARALVLRALATMDSSSLRRDGREDDVRVNLHQARALLGNVSNSRPAVALGSGLGGDARVITEPNETSFRVVDWMREASYLIEQVEDLRLLLADDAPDEVLLRKAGLLRAVGERLGRISTVCESKLIDDVFLAVSRDMSLCDLSANARPGEVQEQLAALCSNLIRTLSGPLPVPDIDHRLLGAGRARFEIYPEGVVKGSGDAADPWVFGPSLRLALKVVVQVELRSDEEALLLRCEDETGQLVDLPVGVHEGSESLEIDVTELGLQKRFVVKLGFVLAGQFEEVFSRRCFLETVDLPDRSDATEDLLDQLSHLRSRKAELDAEIGQLKGQSGAAFTELVTDRRRELAAVDRELAAVIGRLNAAVGGNRE